jgi:hypothetical protein
MSSVSKGLVLGVGLLVAAASGGVASVRAVPSAISTRARTSR